MAKIWLRLIIFRNIHIWAANEDVSWRRQIRDIIHNFHLLANGY